MNDDKQINELLRSALSHNRKPSFLQIRQQAELPYEKEPTPGRERRVILRRLAASCCAVLLVAAVLGTLGSIARTHWTAADAGGQGAAQISNSITTQESAETGSRTYSGGVTAPGAILYNILPTDGNGTEDYLMKTQPDKVVTSLPGGFTLETSNNWDLFTSDSDYCIGVALNREMRRNPRDTYDVVADVTFAEPSSAELVSKLEVQSLLSLNASSYYLKLSEDQIPDCVNANIKLMLVGSGHPVRPQGYPDVFDDGSAWIYDHSPSGEKLTVLLTTLLPDTAQNTERSSNPARDYLLDVLPRYGVEVPDSMSMTTHEMDGQSYVMYQLPLTRQTAYHLYEMEIVTSIQAVPDPNSGNAAEQDYYYKINGDGWAFSN